jgi:hypothetical protein
MGWGWDGSLSGLELSIETSDQRDHHAVNQSILQYNTIHS